MGFVEGRSLAQRVAEGPLSAREAAELVRAIAEAVAHAHSKGVIHRDLKPGNVLIDENGQPRVTDFGLAKQIEGDSNLTGTGQVLGTPSYMPPEQAAGKHDQVGPHSDVYSLGAILYCLLTGRPPFQAPSAVETLVQVIEQNPVAPRVLNGWIDRDLNTICMKCLEKEPFHRYAMARDVVDELDRFLHGEPIHARPLSMLGRSWRWCRRKPVASGLIAVSLTAVLSLLVSLDYRRRMLEASRASEEAEGRADVAQRLVDAEQRARTAEEYASLISGLIQKSYAREWGWTEQAKDELVRAAALETEAADVVQLRSLAATTLSGFDVAEAGVVAEDINAGAIAFSPDGKRLAVGELKHAIAPTMRIYNAQTGYLLDSLTISSVETSLLKLLVQQDSKYQDGISSLTFSNNGRWLAAGTRFGRIICWDTEASPATFLECQGFSVDGEVRGLAFAGNDECLFARSSESAVCRWQVATDRRVEQLPMEADSIAYDASANTLVTVADGDINVYGESDFASPIAKVSDVARPPVACESIHGLIIASGNREIPLFSSRTLHNPDHLYRHYVDLSRVKRTYKSLSVGAGTDLLAASHAQAVDLWSVSGQRLLGTLSVPATNEPNAVISPTAEQLALIRNDKVQLFSLHAEPCVWTTAVQDEVIGDVQWVGDSGTIAVLTELFWFLPDTSNEVETPVMQRVNWWDVDEDRLIAERTFTTFIRSHWVGWHSLAVSPTDEVAVSGLAGPGFCLSSADSTGRTSDRLLLRPRQSLFEVQEREFIVDAPAGSATIEDDPLASDGKSLRIDPDDEVWQITLDPRQLDIPAGDQEWAAYAFVRSDGPGDAGAGIALGTAQDDDALWQQILPSSALAGSGFGLVFVDSFRFSHLSRPRVLFLRSAEDRQLRSTLWIDRFIVAPADFEVAERVVGPVVLSPNGKRIWAVTDRSELMAVTYPELEVAGTWSNAGATLFSGVASLVSVAAGDEWVVVGSGDGKLRLFSAQTPNQPHSTIEGPGGEVSSVALSSDELLAVIGTDRGRLRVVQIPGGETIDDLPGCDDGITSLSLSGDNKTLVAASKDKSAHIWHWNGSAFKRYCEIPLDGSAARVRMSPDGRRIAIHHRHQSSVRIWDLELLQERFEGLGIRAGD